GFAYLTLGIVSAPLEGFIGLKIKKRRDGREYFALQYAGPIRAAGGTGQSISVIIADYVRLKMGYAAYDPDQAEMNRFITEISDYHERVTNLQYRPSEEELRFLLSRLPVEIDGEPTEKITVSNYKDLPRIATNCIRGGMALVLAEGISQKAPKIWKNVAKWGSAFGLDWNWLKEFLAVKEKVHARDSTKASFAEAGKKSVVPNTTYLMDLVAGRPILTHPLAAGGFRLRYGRSRTCGMYAIGLHPATLAVLDKYIAIGTQLKVERPRKSASVTVCETIEGPVVRLKNGSVLALQSEEEARPILTDVDSILFLGDMLVNYGDFSDSGHSLVPAGYCPEWWALEMEKALGTLAGASFAEKAEHLSVSEARLQELLEQPLIHVPSWPEAVQLSEALQIPLHPQYTFYWKLLSGKELLQLRSYLRSGKLKKENGIFQKIILSFDKSNEAHCLAKNALEKAGIPHTMVTGDTLLLQKEEAEILALCLALEQEEDAGRAEALQHAAAEKDGLELLSFFSSLPLRDKAGTFIGARMGRPEKAKMRQLTGSPQCMFPVGEEGDRLRSFQAALKAGKVRSTFPAYFCAACQKEMIYPRCEECGQSCRQISHCRFCGPIGQEACRHGAGAAKPYKQLELPIQYYFSKALQRLGEKVYPDLIKGIRGTSNKNHIVEHLAKGILRAKHHIYVNKDGTTRFDCTELPITHFKPKEIGTSLEKLRELGYEKDSAGKALVDDNQVLELRPQDVILPGFNSLEESASQVLLRVAQFIDDLLVRFYRLEPFYNLKKPQDLVGHLVVGLAPHISVGLVGRIIGFSETQGLFAHPMFHAGMRRDCVHPSTRFVYGSPRQGSFLQREALGPFVEQLLAQGAKSKTIDPFGTMKVELENPLYTFGIDPVTKKMVKKRIRHFIKGPIPQKWVKITTSSNRSYTMTPTHDFLHIVKNQFLFKKAKDIVVGDQVPILCDLSYPLPKIKKLNLLSLLIENVPEKELSNLVVELPFFFKEVVQKAGREAVLAVLGRKSRNLYGWYKQTPLSDVKKLLLSGIIRMESLIVRKATLRVKFSKRVHRLILPVDEPLLSLLGYYAAEGYCRRTKWVSQVCFRIGHPTIQKIITQAIQAVFHLIPSRGEQSTKITIGDQLVYLLFLYCFKAGSHAYNKKVPNFVFHTEKKSLAAYLSAFVDGDGSVVSERNFVILYSVNRSLLDDLALLFARFGMYARYHTTKPRLPGRKVLAIYQRLQKDPVRHVLHHLIFTGRDAARAQKVLSLQEPNKKRKLSSLKAISTPRRTAFAGKQYPLETTGDVLVEYVKTVEFIAERVPSYCLEVEWKSAQERNIVWGEQIINTRCDGDEACVMLLMDALLNFSRQYLPEKRGAKTMDAALVLTSILNPAEVDDQVLQMDVGWKYPLELYEAALEMKSPGEVKSNGKKVEQLADRLGKPEQYDGWGFTHPVDNINKGIQCSAYKTLPSMEEKLLGQMELARKIRAVDLDDVARLVIQKHFLRDIKGNLRKFSTQQFRCVKCNAKYRRPPLRGKCVQCNGNLLFTITEGSVVKYLGFSLTLAEKYDFSPYLKQTLDLLRINVEKIFGKAKEKQVGLGSFL
ncbi:DNA polymerase II large subunit, partial [Candidatus Woesearchaeota archaeon]|nr:DNA polymerase II large subunit [Candidatus Woesearchaeota archaeon]